MESEIFVARIEGTASTLRALPNVSGVTLFDHTDRQIGEDLWKVEGTLTPEAAAEVTALGCALTVLISAEDLRRHDETVRRQIQGFDPVHLVVVTGSREQLADFPARFGIDLPIYTARQLEGDAWEIATEADDATVTILRSADLEVSIVEDAAQLAVRRGEA